MCVCVCVYTWLTTLTSCEMETSNSTVTGSDTFSTGLMNWLYLLNSFLKSRSSALDEEQPARKKMETVNIVRSAAPQPRPVLKFSHVVLIYSYFLLFRQLKTSRCYLLDTFDCDFCKSTNEDKTHIVLSSRHQRSDRNMCFARERTHLVLIFLLLLVRSQRALTLRPLACSCSWKFHNRISFNKKLRGRFSKEGAQR